MTTTITTTVRLTGYTVITVAYDEGEAVETVETGLVRKAATKAYRKARGEARVLDPAGALVCRKAA